MSVITEKDRLSKLGIKPRVPFKLKELTGKYVYNENTKQIHAFKNSKSVCDGVIKGLKESILKGAWTVEQT